MATRATDSDTVVTANVGEMTPRDCRIHVVVVAAQPVVRAGLRRMMEEHDALVVCGEACCTADAVALVAAAKPSVIVLDPDSRDLTLQSVARLVDIHRGTLLVFTAETEPAVHGLAVALGAMGVVQKHQSGDTLRRAIERVHAGEVWLDRQTTASLLRGLQRSGGDDPEDAKIRSLTKRELEVIALVGRGLKNGAIALRLSISQATVRNHLTSILGKLDLADRFELAFYASGHGLVDEPDGLPSLRVPRSVHGQPASGIRTLTGYVRQLPIDVAADFGRKRKPER